jgi:hypothetical protein
MPAFAQIDSRSKFLLAVAGTPLYIPGVTAIDSVMTLGGFTAAAPSGGATGATGTLYRDLGREVVAYDNASALGAGSKKLAVFRQVAIMSGAGSEGITGTTAALSGGAAYPYVQTFSAAASTGVVSVVRTG